MVTPLRGHTAGPGQGRAAGRAYPDEAKRCCVMQQQRCAEPPSQSRLCRLAQHVVTSPSSPRPVPTTTPDQAADSERAPPAPATTAAPAAAVADNASTAERQLTAQQVAFFSAFGYLHLKQLYDSSEIARITDAITTWRGSPEPSPAQPLESVPALTALLLEDRRVHESITQLFEAMGEPSFLLAHSGYGEGRTLRSTMWEGYATLPQASPPAQDEEWTEHGWHADGAYRGKTAPHRMSLYLTLFHAA